MSHGLVCFPKIGFVIWHWRLESWICMFFAMIENTTAANVTLAYTRRVVSRGRVVYLHIFRSERSNDLSDSGRQRQKDNNTWEMYAIRLVVHVAMIYC